LKVAFSNEPQRKFELNLLPRFKSVVARHYAKLYNFSLKLARFAQRQTIGFKPQTFYKCILLSYFLLHAADVIVLE